MKHTEGVNKILWEILVPVTYVDDEGYTKAWSIGHHHAWDEYVRERSGGLTIHRSAKGQWVPGGDVSKQASIEERMIPVRIMCGYDAIEFIAQFTLEHYNQEAVMYYKISDYVRVCHA